MTSHQPATPARLRDEIRRATIDLINEHGPVAVTRELICDRTGLVEAAFDALYPSPRSVFVDIVQTLMAQYGAAMSETLAGSRTLSDAVHSAHRAFLSVVVRTVPEHRALTNLRIAEVGDLQLSIGGAGSSLHHLLADNAELWLQEVGRLHRVQWSAPSKELARLNVASLTGVVLDYLARRDVVSSTQMLDLLSVDLVRRGRRLVGPDQ